MIVLGIVIRNRSLTNKERVTLCRNIKGNLKYLELKEYLLLWSGFPNLTMIPRLQITNLERGSRQ